jgi:O-antigen ligase
MAAHNSYLRHLVESGILGLAAFLWLLLSLFAALWKKLRNNGLAHSYLFIGLLAFTISAVFEDIFSYSVLWAIFWSANVLILGDGRFMRPDDA